MKPCKPDEQPEDGTAMVYCWSYWHPKAKRRIFATNGKPFAWRARPRKPEGNNNPGV